MKDNQEIAKDYTDWMVKTGGYAKDKTLRDHFAGLAMQGMLVGTDCGPDDVAIFVSSAYIMADAMLKERAK
jgi:hypothetical protein